MGVEVKVEGFDSKRIEREVINNDKIGLFAANELRRLMDKYIPKDTGTLAGTVELKPWEVTYLQPYAHFQYVGKLMLSPSGSAWAKKNERKHYVNKDLVQSHEKNPKAAKEWDEDALKERGSELGEAIQNYIERYV